MIQQRIRITSIAVAFLGLAAGFAGAADKADSLLDQMKKMSEQTVVEIDTKDGKQAATLVPAPIFRYDDQPRRITDASLWAWIDKGRLVAFQKVEVNDQYEVPRWTFCFASFAHDPLEVTWPEGRQFQAAAPGVAMHEIRDAPTPATQSFARTQQMKRLAERFSATIVNTPDGSNVQEMRLLPKPVFLYPPKPAVPTVAVFGLTCNGTNPDAYVVLQVESVGGKETWSYGIRRMTTGGVRVRLDDQEVWKTKWLRNQAKPDRAEAWTFFYIERKADPAEADSVKSGE